MFPINNGITSGACISAHSPLSGKPPPGVSAAVCPVCVQLMERAKVSGSLQLPPELMEVMQQLQQGATGLPDARLSRSSSLRRSGSGRFSSTASKVSLTSSLCIVQGPCKPLTTTH